MSLFNKKSDVIDIVLTEHGKKLYSQGLFDPKYYSFHDDDILYDRSYIGLEENSSFDELNEDISSKFGNYSIDKRISNSLSFKAQGSKNSINNPSIAINSNLKENITDLYSFIGTGEFNNQFYPSFDIKLFRGNMTGNISYTTGSGFTHRNPEIHIEVYDQFNQENKSIETDEYFLLRIRELNSVFEKENFDIEFFEITNNIIQVAPFVYVGTTNKKQLSFLPEEFSTQDINPTYFSDIPTNQELVEGLPSLQQSNVEYFFNILTDKNILSDLIYESNPNLPEIEEIKQGIKIC